MVRQPRQLIESARVNEQPVHPVFIATKMALDFKKRRRDEDADQRLQLGFGRQGLLPTRRAPAALHRRRLRQPIH